ncbi:UNKNOWN [Stylonychia lemnae]|uniref:Uncharacterized protein n=1 Tax=Stylonychia lemnae TaxID=5949 RepID=A0A078ALU4_STYLE|nr:UNKNOWN [Stylonychia lemnae]|eukprot:CDW82851.1 UNKNOWN [Stylonychia lemnae]
MVHSSPAKKIFPMVSYFDSNKVAQRKIIVNLNENQNKGDINDEFQQIISQAFGGEINTPTTQQSEVQLSKQDSKMSEFNQLNLFDLRKSQIHANLFSDSKQEAQDSNDVQQQMPNDYYQNFNFFEATNKGAIQDQQLDFIGRISLSSHFSSIESSNAAQIIKGFQEQKAQELRRVSYLRVTPSIVNEAKQFFGKGKAMKGNKQIQEQKSENLYESSDEDDTDLFERDVDFDTGKMMAAKNKLQTKKSGPVKLAMGQSINLFGDTINSQDLSNTDKRESIQRAIFNIL